MNGNNQQCDRISTACAQALRAGAKKTPTMFNWLA
jgi:hypothetical protein